MAVLVGIWYHDTTAIQTRMHTQNYLPPCSRIRPVGKGVRATISVRVSKRYDLKYAAIWRVSASGEIISCTDGSHWLTWKLRIVLDWTRKPERTPVGISGYPARASPSVYLNVNASLSSLHWPCNLSTHPNTNIPMTGHLYSKVTPSSPLQRILGHPNS